MASTQEFVDHVVAQLEHIGEVRAKKMFGEYGIFLENKMFALVCDNKLFMKPTETGRAFIKNVVEAPPYPGAKNAFLIEEKLEDKQWLGELALLTYDELPEPKPKKKKK